MSLDVSLKVPPKVTIFDANITHNLGKMAEAAGIYLHLWRPDELGIKKASQLVAPLEAGLARLVASPHEFKPLDAISGWGTYEQLVAFVEKYLDACKATPDAEVEISS